LIQHTHTHTHTKTKTKQSQAYIRLSVMRVLNAIVIMIVLSCTIMSSVTDAIELTRVRSNSRRTSNIVESLVGSDSRSAHVVDDQDEEFFRQRIPVAAVHQDTVEKREGATAFIQLPTSDDNVHRARRNCSSGFVCPFVTGDCCANGHQCCEHQCAMNEETREYFCVLKNDENLVSLHARMENYAAERASRRARKTRELAAEINQRDANEENMKQEALKQEEFNKQLGTAQERSTKRHRSKVLAHKEKLQRARYREEYDKQRPNHLEFVNEFKAYGGKYRKPQFLRVGDLCIVSGLVRGPNTTLQFTILPSECLPPGRLVFDMSVSQVETARYDILTTGRILFMGGASRAGGSNKHWIPLDGFAFPVIGADQHNIPLESPWTDYGKGNYQGARLYGHDQLCVINGVVRTNDWNTRHVKKGSVILIAPPQCRPNKAIIFHLNHHEHSLRVDLHADGKLVVVAGTYKHSWISLTGVTFTPKPGEPLQLINNWQPYANGYRTPSWVKSENMCIVSGVAKATKGFLATLCQLPPECRPSKRLIFTTSHHGTNSRLDVLSNGEIQYVAGAREEDWLSLDGIFFTVP
jgi:hypothetical protein